MNKKNIDNKNCLITGATGGLGNHLAEILLQNNCNIFLTSRNDSKLRKLQDQLERKNNRKEKRSELVICVF